MVMQVPLSLLALLSVIAGLCRHRNRGSSTSLTGCSVRHRKRLENCNPRHGTLLKCVSVALALLGAWGWLTSLYLSKPYRPQKISDVRSAFTMLW